MHETIPQQADDPRRKPADESRPPEAYDNGRQHLADELLKLDALIHLCRLRSRGLVSNERPDTLGGLCITGEEFDGALRQTPGDGRRAEPGELQSQIEAVLRYIGRLQAEISKKTERGLASGARLPLDQLSRLFRLTPFEQDTLLICLAPELDPKYERLYAYLQDDVTRPYPCASLVLDLLCITPEERGGARTMFHPQAPLFKYGLLRFGRESETRALPSRCLQIDERIADFLLEVNSLDSRTSSFARVVYPKRDWSSVLLDHQCKERLIRLSKRGVERMWKDKLVFCFCGPYGSGKKLTAEAFCRQLGLPLIVADVRDLLKLETDFERTVKLLFREAVLQPAAVYLERSDLLAVDDQKYGRHQRALSNAISDFSFLTFLAGDGAARTNMVLKEHTFLTVQFPIPACPLREDLWVKSLDGQQFTNGEVDIGRLASRFRFTGGQIRDAVADARSLALLRSGSDSSEITMEDLCQSCRAQSNQKLSAMARKITPHYRWSDIVLPADKLRQLKEICNCVERQQTVYGDWGFDRKFALGKGLNVLFCGSSGTGKTMAAEVIAAELRLDLYKIDLSCVVSKYIGETEKNLSKIFREAETSNAIVFFDEADALFGKRSEVRDSHDRYANIEINYLLQKMEEHEGIVILASNLRKNIDEAFTRRMHFSVHFPFPDASSRLKIWQNVFPAETPKNEDIDFEFLARSFKISGGNIKNIALNAAFLAAGETPAVNMEHIIWATRREFQKMGKLCVQSDFGKYYDLIVGEG